MIRLENLELDHRWIESFVCEGRGAGGGGRGRVCQRSGELHGAAGGGGEVLPAKGWQGSSFLRGVHSGNCSTISIHYSLYDIHSLKSS